MFAWNTRTARTILVGTIVASCVGCDQGTKLLAAHLLRFSDPVSALGDTIRLTYAENAGGFLSLGSHLDDGVRQLLFVGLVPVVLLILGCYILRDPGVTLTATVASALIIGGGVGNLIDRVRLGFVRDFANLGFGPVRTGIFNAADVAITVGMLLLIGGALCGRFRAWRAG